VINAEIATLRSTDASTKVTGRWRGNLAENIFGLESTGFMAEIRDGAKKFFGTIALRGRCGFAVYIASTAGRQIERKVADVMRRELKVLASNTAVGCTICDAVAATSLSPVPATRVPATPSPATPAPAPLALG